MPRRTPAAAPAAPPQPALCALACIFLARARAHARLAPRHMRGAWWARRARPHAFCQGRLLHARPLLCPLPATGPARCAAPRRARRFGPTRRTRPPTFKGLIGTLAAPSRRPQNELACRQQTKDAARERASTPARPPPPQVMRGHNSPHALCTLLHPPRRPCVSDTSSKASRLPTSARRQPLDPDCESARRTRRRAAPAPCRRACRGFLSLAVSRCRQAGCCAEGAPRVLRPGGTRAPCVAAAVRQRGAKRRHRTRRAAHSPT